LYRFSRVSGLGGQAVKVLLTNGAEIAQLKTRSVADVRAMIANGVNALAV
jgi:hypothetical protein